LHQSGGPTGAFVDEAAGCEGKGRMMM
jgi:hypothetical protein